MADNTQKDKDNWAISGLFIPGGLFVGMGVGWALGHLTAGLFIGLGAGFVGMAIARLVAGKR